MQPSRHDAGPPVMEPYTSRSRPQGPAAARRYARTVRPHPTLRLRAGHVGGASGTAEPIPRSDLLGDRIRPARGSAA